MAELNNQLPYDMFQYGFNRNTEPLDISPLSTIDKASILATNEAAEAQNNTNSNLDAMNDKLAAFLQGNEADAVNYAQEHGYRPDQNKNKPKVQLDYVNGTHAKIYIGGILVDECYDLYYQYKETKEPIFGYNSKYFDAILDGQVIIYGSFTINYIHDAYLFSILKKSKSEGSYTSDIKQYNKTKENANKYKQSLMNYKIKQQQLNDLKKQLKDKNSTQIENRIEADSEQNKILLKSADLQTKLANAINERESFWNSFTPGYRNELRNKINAFRDMHNGESGSIKEIKDDMNSSLDIYDKKISELETLIHQFDSEINEKRSIQNSLNDLINITPATSSEYSNAIEKANNIESEIMILYEQSESYRLELMKLKEDKDSLIYSYQEMMNQMDQEISSVISNDPDIADAERLDLLIAKIQLDIEYGNSTNDDIVRSNSNFLKDFDRNITNIKRQIGELESELSDLIKQINNIKNTEFELRSTLSNTDPTINEERAEDYKSFTIFIEYNGKIHKVLEDVTLLSHSHVVNGSGECIKEQYMFISRNIK